MMDAQSKQSQCPCCSGKSYAACCQKYHRGTIAENALVLMRSRYSAYAMGVANYLIETTHPKSPYFLSDQKVWLLNIQAFSQQVSFDGLEILDSQLSEPESSVSFVAYLSKDETDLTFSERSRFAKVGHVWKYLDGKIAKGRLTAEQLNQF